MTSSRDLGALYANRWHHDASRFLKRHRRKMPIWLFSSGPFDNSAARMGIAPVGQVRKPMHQIGAAGHQTVSGRIGPDARGFLARSMAKRVPRDWRDPGHVTRWTTQIIDKLADTERTSAI